MEASKTNQTRCERHHNTFTPSLHLVPFCRQLHKHTLCLFLEKGCGRHTTTLMTVFYNHAEATQKSSYFWSYKSLKNDQATSFFFFFFSSLTAVPSENQCLSSGAYEWPVLVSLKHAVGLSQHCFLLQEWLSKLMACSPTWN